RRAVRRRPHPPVRGPGARPAPGVLRRDQRPRLRALGQRRLPGTGGAAARGAVAVRVRLHAGRDDPHRPHRRPARPPAARPRAVHQHPGPRPGAPGGAGRAGVLARQPPDERRAAADRAVRAELDPGRLL
ncbi:MAG: hypothetical protein AVDCRST_MAG66-547, partial [uncultured Pseudonocardia sp.]